jgi:hypothetical protein
MLSRRRPPVLAANRWTPASGDNDYDVMITLVQSDLTFAKGME